MNWLNQDILLKHNLNVTHKIKTVRTWSKCIYNVLKCILKLCELKNQLKI